MKILLPLGIPILGICYGMQLGCQMLGATVQPTATREYGRTACTVNNTSKLFKSITKDITVWMSHGDQVVELPTEFESLAFTKNCPYAAVKHKTKAFYGVSSTPKLPILHREIRSSKIFSMKFAGVRVTGKCIPI